MNTPFDPASIEKYSVIRVRHKFIDSAQHEYKRFIVLGRVSNYLICIKATSHVEIYKNNSEKMAGCIFYKAQELSFFEKETAIEPDNPVAISYDQLIQNHNDGELQVLGQMPDTFEVDLLDAIHDSVTLSGVEAKRLIKLIKS